MITTLLFAPAVETDVADAALWYESQRVGLGLELVQALDDTLEKIRLTPNAGSPWHEYRRRIVRRFPYIVFYKVLGPAQIEITAVAHMSRRPGYWLDR